MKHIRRGLGNIYGLILNGGSYQPGHVGGGTLLFGCRKPQRGRHLLPLTRTLHASSDYLDPSGLHDPSASPYAPLKEQDCMVIIFTHKHARDLLHGAFFSLTVRYLISLLVLAFFSRANRQFYNNAGPPNSHPIPRGGGGGSWEFLPISEPSWTHHEANLFLCA